MIESARLLRISEEPEAVRGVLLLNEKPYFTTLELPWHDNQKNISCIPPGNYKVLWGYSEHLGGEQLELQNVPNRLGIFIHTGNVPDDILGCILIGLSYGEITNVPAVLQSQKAMIALRELLGSQKSFMLRIGWAL